MDITVLMMFLFLMSILMLLESIVIAIGTRIGFEVKHPNRIRIFISIISFCITFIGIGAIQNYERVEEEKETKPIYDEGYSAGYDAGYDTGYYDGFSEAKETAYNEGYDAAKAEIEEAKVEEGSEPKEEIETVSEKETSKYSGLTAEQKIDKLEKDTFIEKCITADYNDILRNPDRYDGTGIVVSGKIDQIISGITGTQTFYIKDSSGNKWGCTYTYKDGESHYLEGDNVTAYGQCQGTGTTATLLGKQVTLPIVSLKYIE